MRVKDSSVLVDNLDPAMRHVFKAADRIWHAYGQELVITAGREVVDDTGKFIHSPGSLHAFGRAVDLRTNYFDEYDKSAVARELATALGTDFDVVIESTHIHCEYDPG